MRHQVRPNSLQISIADPSVTVRYSTCVYPQNVCGRGNTVHSHHRVGYDGQNQILSTQHAVLIFSQMLPISSDSDQNSSSSTKTKSHVQWYICVIKSL